MAGKKKSYLDTLNQRAKLIGLDIDVIVAEVTETIVKKVKDEVTTPDIEALAYKVADLLKDSLPAFNTQQIEVNITDKMQKAVSDVSDVFSEKIKALDAGIQPRLEAIFAANRDALIESFKETVKGTPSPSGGGLSSIIDRMPPDAWSAIIGRIFAPSGGDLGMLLRGMNIGNKLKTGELKIEDLEKAFGPTSETR